MAAALAATDRRFHTGTRKNHRPIAGTLDCESCASLQAISAPRINGVSQSIGPQLPQFTGFTDTQAPIEFLDRLKSFCLLTGVPPESRVTQLVPAALDRSAKLRWKFWGGFGSWDDFASAFQAEFAPLNCQCCLKEELEQRT